MYKMIVFDIDGTLIPYLKNNFSKEIEQMLFNLKKNGYIVCLATGRDFISIADIHKNENIDYFIGANGSFIYDLKKDEYLFNSSIEFEEFENYKNEVLLNNLDGVKNVILSDENNVFVWELIEIKGPWFWQPFKEKFKNIELAKHEIEKDKFHLITITHDNSQLLDLSREYFKNMNSSLDIQSWWSNGFFIANKKITKMHSINYLCNHLKISTNQVIAFGDGENDMEMIKEVGLGVAMGNAIEELKKIANEITIDVEEHGTKHFLEKIGII